MSNKQYMGSFEELNEIELERASYLINLDELIFKTLDRTFGTTRSLHMDLLEDINLTLSLIEDDSICSSNVFRRFVELTCPEVIAKRKLFQTDLQGLMEQEPAKAAI